MRRVLLLLATVACATGGYLLIGNGFARVDKLRTIERIPRTTLALTVPGEANVQGEAHASNGRTIRGPKTGAETLVCRYLVERKETDSEGRTRWATVSDNTSWVDFLINDGSWSARVEPAGAEILTLSRKFTTTEGNRRYTEFRIDAGDLVFVMGIAHEDADGLSVGFTADGDFVPILSAKTEAEERADIGGGSLLNSFLGLVCLSFFVFFVSRIIGINQTITFSTLLAVVIFATLAAQAWVILRQDLLSAYERLEREFSVRAERVALLATEAGVEWDRSWAGLPDALNQADLNPESSIATYAKETRIHLMRLRTRAERLRAGIPERWIAAIEGLEAPPAFPLTAEERSSLERLESNFTPTRLRLAAGLPAGIIGLVLAFFLGRSGIRTIKVKRWIENLPTLRPDGVVYGTCEVSGTVVTLPETEALAAPLSGEPCTAFSYLVQERRGSGKKARWVTIESVDKSIRFGCSGADGAVLPIEPDGAELIFKTATTKREGPRLYTEKRLPLGATLYALGPVTVDPETHDRLILAPAGISVDGVPYLLSDHSEAELVRKKTGVGFLTLTFGLNALMATGLLLAGVLGGFGATPYLTAALTPVAYLTLLVGVLLYNDLVFLRRRCDAAWANIDVALRKRFDLLPRLAEVSQAYLGHEKDLQKDLARMRVTGETGQLQAGNAAETLAAEARLATRFFALREAYPDLKSSEVMADLFHRIRDLEDEIALMREGYNHAVEIYNTRRLRIPEILFTKLFRFENRDFFHTADIAMPRIELNN